MPEIPQMPRTMRETVTAIWYTLHNGMSNQIIETHAMAQDTATRVQAIEKVVPTLWTKEEHDRAHESYVAELDAQHKSADEKRDRRGMSLRDWLMLGLVAVSIWAVPWITHLIEGTGK